MLSNFHESQTFKHQNNIDTVQCIVVYNPLFPFQCPLEGKYDMTDAKILKNITPQECPLQTVR